MEALEKALRARPDDLDAWLVYGDWLLEQHDVRGSLIQLQDRWTRARAAERVELRRESDALIAQHQAAWTAALPAGVTGTAWKFGFVTKVAVTWSDDAPAIVEEALRALPFANALRIVAPKVEGDDDDGVDEDGEPIPRPVVDIAALGAIDLARLAELDLSYVNIGPDGAKAIVAPVSVLDVRYCYLGDTGLATLATSPLAESVRRLHLQSNQISETGAMALQKFSNLVELDLRYNEIGAAGAKALLDAPFITSLARLDLYRSDVTEDGAKELARSNRLPAALRGYWRSV